MVLTPAIAHLIRAGKIFRINSEIQTGSRYGMQLMDDVLFEKFKKRLIKYQDMMEKCVNPQEMMSKVRESGLARGGGAGGGGAANAAAANAPTSPAVKRKR
jgi:twitching motility protein PilT